MIKVERRDAVELITIDRPDRRNAVDASMLRELAESVEGVQHRDVRAVVLTGAGGTFCAGADLAAGVHDDDLHVALGRALTSLATAAVPTIAAVDGAALGAGMQLAIACDLRTATDRARFAIPASRLGLMIDGWTVHRLVRTLGWSLSTSVLVAAESIGVEQAFGSGFVHRRTDLDGALAWATELAGMAPLAVAGHKLALASLDPYEPDEIITSVRSRVWSSDDAREGRAAFLEKRPPRFTGT